MLNEIDLSRADLNLLVLFEVVMEEGHVGRASERLSLSPSAVSHGLGRLRTWLNDPLFLRSPKGVVPTARAIELAPPIADILARIRSVAAVAAPFDPRKSTRRFTVSAPDGVSAVFMPALLAALAQQAPGIDVALRQMLPVRGESDPERAWRNAWAELDGGELDIAIVPSDAVPARFHVQRLYEERFVVATRRGHRFAERPTLDRYCEQQHLVVSATGDAMGFVDALLAEQGRSRRVALTVPTFMQAITSLAGTDLLAALPGRFLALYGQRFGVVGAEPPFAMTRFGLNAVVPKAAMADGGVAWLLGVLRNCV